MQIIRTIIWVVLVIALVVFSINNWQPVEIKIWEDLVLETKIPALVIVSFLLGFLPIWLLHYGTRWRLKRRINSLESAVRRAVGVKDPPSAGPAPITPDPALADQPHHPETNEEK